MLVEKGLRLSLCRPSLCRQSEQVAMTGVIVLLFGGHPFTSGLEPSKDSKNTKEGELNQQKLRMLCRFCSSRMQGDLPVRFLEEVLLMRAQSSSIAKSRRFKSGRGQHSPGTGFV